MRELKFRVWDSDSSQMFFVPNIQFGFLGSGEAEDNFPCFYGLRGHSFTDQGGHVFSKTNMTIEQYTGLKDKNEVEIYEGDIIKNTNAYEETDKCIVSWSKYEEVGWALYYPYYYTYSDEYEGETVDFSKIEKEFNGLRYTEEYPMSYLLNKGYEVVGNIHENPEILAAENGIPTKEAIEEAKKKLKEWFPPEEK